MNKFIILILVLAGLLFSPPVHAQRIAECDACGYCDKREPPENWLQCVQCLYPTLYNPTLDPTLNTTLEILTDPNDARQPDPEKPIINQPIPPAQGKYFTQLGCIDTSLSSFQDPSAAGGVLNFILNTLIFPTAGALAFLALLYGAFLLMTAKGDPFQIQNGKKYITGAITGLIFTFAALLLVALIGGDVLRIPWLQNDPIKRDLKKINEAVNKLATDTGQLPRHHDASRCQHNEEVLLNDPRAGLIANDGLFPSTWKGPYLSLADVTDPNGNPYFFDPDYRCRPDVAGCEDVAYPPPNPYDYLSSGRSESVRAIVYQGPDNQSDYCNALVQNICKEPGIHFDKFCTPTSADRCRDVNNVRYPCNNIQRNPVDCIRTDLDNVVLVQCE